MLEYLPVLTDFVLLAQCVLLLWLARRLQEKVDLLARRVASAETQTSDLSRSTGSVLFAQEKDLKELKEAVDQMQDGVNERNHAEAKMFEGLSNIFNYDYAQARKAVGDGGEE